MHHGAFCFRCRVNKEQIFRLLYFWFYGGHFINHNTVKFIICVVLTPATTASSKHHLSFEFRDQLVACENIWGSMFWKGAIWVPFLRKALSATGTGLAHWPKVLLRASGPGEIHGGLNTLAGGHRKSSAGTQGTIICLTSLCCSHSV